MVLDETLEQRRRRHDAVNARARARRAAVVLDETPEQRRRRLDAVNARTRARRASESPEEARRRRERVNAHTRARRLEGGEAITRERRNERQQARRLSETEESRRRRLDAVNERARLSHGILTAQRRALRHRATEQQRADESRRRADERMRERLAETDALEGFGTRVLSAVALTPADIDHMASGQRFTTDPRLALAYFFCCGVDPAAFVFGDERLRGADSASVRERLSDVLDGNCPGQMDIGECQRLVQQCEAEAVDVWACAACGRILLNGSGSGEVYFRCVNDLDSVVLTAEERREVDAAMPAHTARAYMYRQLLFDGDEVYYLIPELVRDRDKVPLCKNCNADARKSKFSVACGHDYGRVENLPALSEAALSCVIPTRCFGVEISLSGKHCSGHTICFPSDGPSKVARVLPDLDPACMSRVTFIGPLEEWRIQQHKYRGLYAIPADDVYKVLSVLSYVNNIFREEGILIDDTSDRRRALHEMEKAIHANVNVIDSPLERDVEDKATSERYGDDVMDGCVNGGVDEVTAVNMRSSAVLPPVRGTDTGAVREIIDAILEDVDPAPVRGVEGARSVPVIPIKQGQTPLVEWYENAKILAGEFPLLFLTGSGPLPSGPLPRDYVEHYMNYWDGRFEKSTQFTAMLFNQLQRHAAVRKAARAGLTHGKVLSNFGKLVNTADFKDALRDAKTNPERPESVRLNAQLLRLLSLVGGTVPFSPFERAATRPKLSAMRYHYGIAQIWATIAPPEHDDLLLHRIALLRRTDSWDDPQALGTRRECRFTDFSTEIQTSARARLEISRAYPALSAQVSQRRLEAFTRCIIRCRESSRTRVSNNYRERPVGVYGRVAGFNAVIEPQVDGRLHAHFTIYGSAVTPDLLTRLACCQDLWPNVRRWFDAVSCTGVPTEVRDWCEDWRRSRDGKMPRAFDIPVPDASVDFEGFKMAAMRRVLSTNTHIHSGMCRKGVRGRCSCRLARPAGVFEGETQPLLIQLNRPSNPAKRSRAEFTVRTVDDEIAGCIDKGPDYHENRLLREPTYGAIVWEQDRPLEDAMFVETNITLACLSKSHTNSSIINGRDAGDMVEEYQQAYMLKEKGGG